jgi:hypothetical protein
VDRDRSARAVHCGRVLCDRGGYATASLGRAAATRFMWCVVRVPDRSGDAITPFEATLIHVVSRFRWTARSGYTAPGGVAGRPCRVGAAGAAPGKATDARALPLPRRLCAALGCIRCAARNA